MADTENSGAGDQLKDQFQQTVKLLGEKAIGGIGQRVSDMTDQLNDVADGGPAGDAVKEGIKAKTQGGSAIGGALKGGASGVKDKVKEAVPGMSSDGGDDDGGGGGGGDQGARVVNIIESIDVGLPLSLAYNAWTEWEAWPTFTRKVEHAKQDDDEPTVSWKAQIFLSHRSWEATIQMQIPDERIVWRSTGQKGHVDGAVTFHELGPNLTRILLVLEYHPQGFFEKTANLWRAQGRRARSDFRHFRRHVMINTIQDPDSVEGWRGEIRDEEVVRTHDEVVEQEQQQREDQEDQEDSEEGSEEADSGQPEDAADEEGSEEPEDEEADEEYEESEEEEPEDGAEDEYEEEPEDEQDDVEDSEGR